MSGRDFKIEKRGRYDDPAHATHGDLLTVREIIRNSLAAVKLERWDAADRSHKRGGRGPFASFEQMLTIWFLLARKRRPMTMFAAVSLLVYGIEERTRDELGLDITGLTPDQICYRLRRSNGRMLEVIDPYPCQRNRLMTKDEFIELEAAVDWEARMIKEERLRTVVNAMVMATIPKWVRERHSGDIVQDATLVAAYGRGTKTNSEFMGIEPYGGYYARHGDHSPESIPGPGRNTPELKGYGWEGTFSLLASNDPDRKRTFPSLVAGVNLSTPGGSPGRSGIHAVRHIPEAGFSVGKLIGDRAYGNSPQSQDYQVPARRMGYELLFDHRPEYWGQTFTFNGAVILEGNVYSPAILSMAKLITATVDRYKRDYDDPERIDETTYQQRLQQRARYLVQFRTGLDAEGRRQGRCPASGPNPTLMCPLRELANNAGIEKGKTLMPVPKSKVPSEETRGGLCNNSGGSMVLEGEYWDKHAMAGGFQYGTPQWQTAYNVPRQTVESYNRLIKDHSSFALAAPDRRRIRGYAAAFLLMGMLVMATNLYLLGRWEDPKIDARGRGPLREVAKRRREYTNGPERPHPKDKKRPRARPAVNRPAPKVLVGIN